MISKSKQLKRIVKKDFIGDDDTVRAEQCIVCGKVVNYHKLLEGTMVGQVDQKQWRENHKIDCLQPWLPDGTPNPDFIKYYGKPEDLINKREIEIAKAQLDVQRSPIIQR